VKSLGRAVQSWTSATVEYVLANAGAMAVAYPTVSLASTLAGSPAPAVVPLVAFALAFGASYPLVAGDWSTPRLYDALLVAACCAVLASALTAGLAVAFGVEPAAPQRVVVTAGWVLSLAVAAAAVVRFDVGVFA
jgi:hypothetical protein